MFTSDMREKEVNIMEARVLPHDMDTEQAVLSALIMYNENYTRYGDMLGTELFYYEKEKAIFRCIDGVINDGNITDINSLYGYAQSHSVGYELMRGDFVELVSNFNRGTVEQDIERLRDMSRRRMSWRLLQEAAQGILDMTNSADEIIGGVVSSLIDAQGDEASGIVSHNESLKSIMKTVEKNRSDKSGSLLTGFNLLDEKYVLRPETMTVIAAFTSVGKSALALNIVEAVARQGVPCAYYSLEMSHRELTSRLISRDAEISTSAMLNKSLTDEQVEKLQTAVRKNVGLPIYYDDKSTTDFNRTMRSVRKMVKMKKVQLVVIDYLQIYSQVSEDVEQGISYMARTAKNIAKEMGIAVIVISQLNRSALHPSMKMLRGSGQIEESADNVILIDRPEAYPDNKVTHYEGEFKNVSIHNTAKLILSKGRGIGTGSCIVGFNGKEVRFYEIEKPVEGEKYMDNDEVLPF